LPKDLPEFIVVDLTALDVGNSVHVSALQLPPGVTVVTRGKTDPVLASAVVPKAHVEEVTEAAAEAEAAVTTAGAAPAAGAEGKPAAEAKAGDKKEAGKDDKKKDSGKDDKKK
jgi:large subunit ribosomal protein L25